MSRILIVDDDVTMTGLLEALMMMEGHQPTTVNDSRKAMDIAASMSPDLITLDLMMPGISGLELCELLHADSRFADIPVLIVSAKDDPESKMRAMKAGAKDYVVKPFDVDQLIKKVRELTNSR